MVKGSGQRTSEPLENVRPVVRLQPQEQTYKKAADYIACPLPYLEKLLLLN